MLSKFPPFVRLALFASVCVTCIGETRAQSPVVPVPPPQPAATIAPPSRAPIAPFVAAPDQQQIERAKPQVRVFRGGADVAQTPERYGNHLRPVLIPGDESVLVQLQFDSALAGKAVEIRSVRGLVLSPSDAVLKIGARGEVVFQVAVEPGQSTGRMSIWADNVATVLHFGRVSLSTLQKLEGAQ